jgi:hypothetical protein
MNSKRGNKKLPDDLQDVAKSLRDQRSALEPLELDRIKLRAMSGARRKRSSGLGAGTRSRATAFLTVAFLALGTGGALALHSGKGIESGGKHHSASYHQYRPCRGVLSGYGKCVPIPPPPPICKGKLSGYGGKCVPLPGGGKAGKGGRGGKGGKGGKGRKAPQRGKNHKSGKGHHHP